MNSITSRIPAAEYHAMPGVSITRLKELKRSPMHYRYLLEHPKESPALTLGVASHCSVLEPERFSREFAIWDKRTEGGAMAQRRGKDWEAFKAEHSDHTIITQDDSETAKSISAAVRGDICAMKYLATGDPEVTMSWELDGLACRGRADWLTSIAGQPHLVGLKTARDCRPFIFGSAAAKLGYHLQWAFYYDGYLTLTGEKPRMIEIVVESAAPHAVAVYFIPDDIIEQGREEYQDLLKLLAECEASNHWPGPASVEQALTLPSWVYGEDIDDVAELGLES